MPKLPCTTMNALRLKLLAAALVAGSVLCAGVLAQRLEAAGDGRPRQGPPHQSAPFTAQPRVDLIPGRPTAQGVSLSMLAQRQDETAQLWIAPVGSSLAQHGDALKLAVGVPLTLELKALRPQTRYAYELRSGAAQAELLAAGHFQTQRTPGSGFSFTLTADSHLDQNTDPDLYLRTLEAVRADAPDFHIDLGDTFMVDKHAGREAAAAQYLQQRFYFGRLGVPLFLVLGNHDGEDGKLLRQGAESLGVWANQMRRCYFPNPQPDGFYSGNAQPDPLAGMLQDYYAWTWGDALFVVLDPYWHMPARRSDERWNLSLGEAQYHWLRRTLESSQARHKFVFVHQLLGGLDRQGRGGVEGAAFGEWGGRNADGSEGLKQHRPGWPESIHALLVRTGVTAVFHGHDHLFARQQLDGIVYQEVPQPAHPGPGHQQAGTDYGYRSGVIMGDSGYLRVQVGPDGVLSEFVGTQGPQPRVLHRDAMKDRP